MKKIFFLLCVISVGIFLGGCVASYDELPAMPEYPELNEKFDTTAIVDIRWLTEDSDFNKDFVKVLINNNYHNILCDKYFYAQPLKNVNILAVWDAQQEYYSCKDSDYIDTRVIVMIRRPGIIAGNDFMYSAPRYFQAFSQVKVEKLDPDEDVQKYYRVGKYEAINNLFRIKEFRQALEPYENDIEISNDGCLGPDGAWKIAKKYQSAGFIKIYSAVYWALKAVENENKEAEKFLADKIKYLNVFNDEKRYFSLVEKLARKGYPEAQNELALFYLNGFCCSVDESCAFKWFCKAAEQNYSESLFYVGYCYENGKGVIENHPKALEYYTKAAKLGYIRAVERLEELE